MQYLLALFARARRHHVAMTLLGFAVAVVVVGGILFAVTQHIPVTTGLYWAVVTAATVGYGDVIPKDGAGRVIAIAVMLTAIPLLGAVFAQAMAVTAAVHIRRLLGEEGRLPDDTYRIVYGMHPSVPRLLEELVRAGDRVVLVAEGVDAANLPHGVHLLAGNPTTEAVIVRSHPQRAQHALLVGEDSDVLVTAVLLGKISPQTPITALARSASIAGALRELGVAHTLSVDDLLAHTLAKTLESPHAAELLLRVVDSETYRLRELAVGPRWADHTLSAVRAGFSGFVLGAVHQGAVTLGIDDDPSLAADDWLLVLTDQDVADRAIAPA